jgi:hypothetical protein
MVDFQQLASAKPTLWSSAADDWMALSKDLTGAADDLAAEARQPIAGSWTGPAGQAAHRRIQVMYYTLQAGGVLTSAVGEVLRGLGHAVTLAQETLQEARELAQRNDLSIGADGSVTAKAHSPSLPGSQPPPPLGVLPDPGVEQVTALIREAVREATQADEKAQAELTRLSVDSVKVDSQAALQAKDLNDYLQGFKDTDANDASRTELQVITDSIPQGPPELVSQWWAGLSPEEQNRLRLAAPGILGTLNGIPADVQAELRGSDGIDRVKLVNYALDNWDNTAINVKGADNCTNFVSHALAEAGLHEKGHESEFWGRSDSEHNWYQGTTNDSYSWAGAGQLHTFLTRNNRGQVPRSDAKPGDIIFWGRGDGSPSTIHHAAVVTAVVDGHVYYTQHSGSAENADFNLRQPTLERTRGPNPPIVVRPHQD